MKIKQLVKILMAILIISLISGCIDLTKKDDITKVSTLYKGTSGLKLSFVKNAPPSRVFENTDFNVIVKIENKGTYDIGFGEEGIEDEYKKGIFVITPETGYVDLEKTEENENIEVNNEDKSVRFKVTGKSLSNPVGEYIFIYSTLKAKKLGSLSTLHESSIFASVCYRYQTKLSANACIDPDVYNLKPQKKACSVKDMVFTSGQGAPVAITKIEVQMAPADNNKIKPVFLVHIENKGDGEVIKRENYFDACGAEIKNEIKKAEATSQLNKYFNVININDEGTKLSNYGLECKQGDNKEMVLSGKKGIIRCELKDLIEADIDAYVSPLSIVLDYGYSATISKDFNIEKPLK